MATAAGKIVHVILDNYGTHKHPKVAWLERHPRFVFHFTPTSCYAVETFFAKLSKRRLKRGVFHSIVNLQTAINRFIAETNDDPTPFVWMRYPAAPRTPSLTTVRANPLELGLSDQFCVHLSKTLLCSALTRVDSVWGT